MLILQEARNADILPQHEFTSGGVIARTATPNKVLRDHLLPVAQLQLRAR